MAKSIMIQGTTSNAGKSLVTAGLCRIFMQDGYKVAPFKSQNMALNSFITKDGHEMGRAQVMQAEACGIDPDVRMNPVLLKPTSDEGSQVIVNGSPIGNMSAKDYFEYKNNLAGDIQKTYDSLASEFDIIVIEGAGSPAEINLKHQDIVNMGMAKMAKSPVLIVGDIDRGGVFAALAGTMLLLDDDEKSMVKGTVINKFRGDKSILKPGLTMLEDIIHVPVVGVLPYLNIEIDDEDSLSDTLSSHNKTRGLIDIAVIRLPRISNFTDFNPLQYIDGVSLRYVGSVSELNSPDLIIIPGSKNTMGDLLWLRQSGFEASILKYVSENKPVFGVCGGYQMLGTSLSDPHSVEFGGEMAGLGILPFKTVFSKEKTQEQTTGKLDTVGGIFASLSGLDFSGYEIHMGVSDTDKNIVNLGNVYGTYIHGIFDMQNISKNIIKDLLNDKGLDFSNIESFNIEEFKQSQYDILADSLREALDMDQIYKILNEGV